MFAWRSSPSVPHVNTNLALEGIEDIPPNESIGGGVAGMRKNPPRPGHYRLMAKVPQSGDRRGHARAVRLAQHFAPTVEPRLPRRFLRSQRSAHALPGDSSADTDLRLMTEWRSQPLPDVDQDIIAHTRLILLHIVSTLQRSGPIADPLSSLAMPSTIRSAAPADHPPDGAQASGGRGPGDRPALGAPCWLEEVTPPDHPKRRQMDMPGLEMRSRSSARRSHPRCFTPKHFAPFPFFSGMGATFAAC